MNTYLSLCTALLLIPIMLVVTYTHIDNGWQHTSPGGGWEYPVFLAVALLAMAYLR